jgi:hypothetical protein
MNMAKVDYDGVIQAAHYTDDGQLGWVRAFLRRGPVWSDTVQIERDDLVDKINSGLRFRTGRRLLYQGGTFDTSFPVKVVKINNHQVLHAGDSVGEVDKLEGVPLI